MAKQALIVDDSATIRQLVGFTLTGAGFDVIEAADGQEAVGMLDAGARPSLVITDLNMPRMDGIAFTRALRTMPALQSTPVLMLTTESDGTRKKEGQAAGVTGWILKPFIPETMLRVVATVVPS